MHRTHERPPTPAPEHPAGPALLGFGGWAVGGSGWGRGPGRAERLAAIERALENGVSFFDTAPNYGESEELLGEALHRVRERVTIATKVPPRADPRTSIEASLRRLRTDRVDLLQLHEPFPGFERSLEVMHELREEGKAVALGLANATPAELRRAARAAPLAASQGPYNLVDRDAEYLQLPVCEELGLMFLGYRPLAAGILAGGDRALGDDDHRRRIYWFRGRELQRRRALVEELREIARRLGRSPSQLALGWALGGPGVGLVLAGARTPGQAEENAGASPLSTDDRRAVDTAVAAAFRPPRATDAARSASRGWGDRERFIVERLDGRRSYEAIAAEWSAQADRPMVAAQVKVFGDQLAERGLAVLDD
jgi:aryl-alcohol dehydrogenase-like predicted oxidoreductase